MKILNIKDKESFYNLLDSFSNKFMDNTNISCDAFGVYLTFDVNNYFEIDSYNENLIKIVNIYKGINHYETIEWFYILLNWYKEYMTYRLAYVWD